MPSQDHAVAAEAHADGPTSFGCLKADELAASDTRSPVGSKCAMGGAGHRIFGDAGVRREHAAHNVGVGSWVRSGSDDERAPAEGGDARLIGLEIDDISGPRQLDEPVVPRDPGPAWRREPSRKCGKGSLHGIPRRELISIQPSSTSQLRSPDLVLNTA
jgi:hypothetical protein